MPGPFWKSTAWWPPSLWWGHHGKYRALQRHAYPITPHFSYEQGAEMVASGVISLQSHTYDMHQWGPYESTDQPRETILPLEGESEADYRASLSCRLSKNPAGHSERHGGRKRPRYRLSPAAGTIPLPRSPCWKTALTSPSPPRRAPIPSSRGAPVSAGLAPLQHEPVCLRGTTDGMGFPGTGIVPL